MPHVITSFQIRWFNFNLLIKSTPKIKYFKIKKEIKMTDTLATNMRIAITNVESTYQPIFSLVAELEQQGFAVDSASLQAILDALKALMITIKDDVAV
jgi:hypothetical protein